MLTYNVCSGYSGLGKRSGQAGLAPTESQVL